MDYCKPECEIILFGTLDVIRTSVGTGTGDGPVIEDEDF